jgi:hypothetical protein
MTSSSAVITHPIALCAYVLFLVFGLLAKRWSASSHRRDDRALFWLAAGLGVLALAGGLTLAWRQTATPQGTASAAGASGRPSTQTTSGNNSAIISGSGNMVNYGTLKASEDREKTK